MTEDQKQQLRIAEGGDWQLGVKEEFKQLVGENPDLVPTILLLIKSLKLIPQFSAERNGVKCALVDFRVTSHATIYEISFKGQQFFLKVNSKQTKGFDEMIGSAKAQEFLSGVPHARVVDFQLGYSDKQHQFFVSKWEDHAIENLSDYIDRCTEDERKTLLARVHIIIERLKDFYYVTTKNMFFDPDTSDIVVFDIVEKNARFNT